MNKLNDIQNLSDATHYDPASGLFFKVSNENFSGTQFIWMENKWCTTEWSSAFEATLKPIIEGGTTILNEIKLNYEWQHQLLPSIPTGEVKLLSHPETAAPVGVLYSGGVHPMQEGELGTVIFLITEFVSSNEIVPSLWIGRVIRKHGELEFVRPKLYRY